MNTIVLRSMVLFPLVVFLSVGTVFADVSVSVTITGSVDELIPVLQELRKLGIGRDAVPANDEALRVQLHSVSPTGPSVAATVKPTLAFTDAAVFPARARAGETVLVTLRLSDPQGKVDTIGTALSGVDGPKFDLYDNGTRGDLVAGDGIWSYSLVIPGTAEAGDYAVVATAYDPNGTVVTVRDDEGSPISLMGKAVFRVVP